MNLDHQIDRKRKKIFQIIKRKAIIHSPKEVVVSANDFNQTRWVLDVRRAVFEPEFLDLVTDVFWDIFEKEYPFQVGGQELSAIPLVTAIVMKGKERGKKVNGFIIRKSRKTHDLRRIIEGEINDNEKIILVDDLLNSGTTFSRQLRVLAQKRRDFVFALFSIVRFQKEINPDLAPWERLGRIYSLCSLQDLGIKRKLNPPPKEKFKVKWYFKSPNPNLGYDFSKSSPVLDDKKIYFGSDDRKFWALDQKTGKVSWFFRTGHKAGEKSIFSSPVIYKDKVYFGSYDGNVYALDKEKGTLIWQFKEADFVSSSPCVAESLGSLFIGLEFGLRGRRGGVVALDLETGKKKWDFRMKNFVSASPAFFPDQKKVFIGSNEGAFFCFDAKKGKLLWIFKAEAEIKATPSFSEKYNLVIIGSFDKKVYFLDIKTGEPKYILPTQDWVFSTPLVMGDFAFISSSDKSLYKFNLKKGKQEWRVPLAGRIFSSPVLIKRNIFLGCNDGLMYEIDPSSGKILSFFLATERITNNVVYNPKNKKFFVSTYANEVYCLERKREGKRELATIGSMVRSWNHFYSKGA